MPEPLNYDDNGITGLFCSHSEVVFRRFQNKKLSARGFSLWHFFPSLLFSSTCFFILLPIISTCFPFVNGCFHFLVRPILYNLTITHLRLFKVLYTGFKDLNILFSVNVDSHSIATTLAVCHLTEDTSVRTCDTFNSHI